MNRVAQFGWPKVVVNMLSYLLVAINFLLKIFLGWTSTKNVRVVAEIFSKNMLAQKLATTRAFKTDETHLTFKHRMPLLIKELIEAIGAHKLIALQEIDDAMFAVFKPIFDAAEYEVVRGQNEKNGGVVCAYPKDNFVPKNDAVAIRIGELVTKEQCETPFIANVTLPDRYAAGGATKCAQLDGNMLIGLHLVHKESGLDFWLFNYHMPCYWWGVPFMMLFIDTLKKTMKRIAGETPFILCSDTNAQKGNVDRVFLETGKCDYQQFMPSPEAIYPLTDSMVHAGMETTRCKPAADASDLKNGEFFTNIDGQFSSGLDKAGVMLLSEVKGFFDLPCPNELEGSDHFALHGVICAK